MIKFSVAAIYTCCRYLQQVAIKAQVRNFIDTHQVVCTGPFVYAYVEEVGGCRNLVGVITGVVSCRELLT